MRQQPSQAGFENYARESRRELFLEEMKQIVPWAELEAMVEPHYPNGREWVSAGWSWDHAAGLLCAAVVQSE